MKKEDKDGKKPGKSAKKHKKQFKDFNLCQKVATIYLTVLTAILFIPGIIITIALFFAGFLGALGLILTLGGIGLATGLILAFLYLLLGICCFPCTPDDVKEFDWDGERNTITIRGKDINIKMRRFQI